MSEQIHSQKYEQATMLGTASEGLRFQFSMSGLVLIITATALILWLSELWEGSRGLASAIALCAVPYNIANVQ